MPNAPQPALDYLRENPDSWSFFKKRYGYLPDDFQPPSAPQEALDILKERPDTIEQFENKFGYRPNLEPEPEPEGPPAQEARKELDAVQGEKEDGSFFEWLWRPEEQQAQGVERLLETESQEEFEKEGARQRNRLEFERNFQRMEEVARRLGGTVKKAFTPKDPAKAQMQAVERGIGANVQDEEKRLALTEEAVEQIKTAPSLEEKVKLAIKYGVSREDIYAATRGAAEGPGGRQGAEREKRFKEEVENVTEKLWKGRGRPGFDIPKGTTTGEEDSWGNVLWDTVRNAPAVFGRQRQGLKYRSAEEDKLDLDRYTQQLERAAAHEGVSLQNSIVLEAIAASEGKSVPGYLESLAQERVNLSKDSDEARQAYERHTQYLENYRPRTRENSAKWWVGASMDALLNMGPSIGVGILTKNPNLALGIMGTQVFGDTYGQARKDGRTHGEATMDATAAAVFETVAEKIPLDYIIKNPAGDKLLKRVLKSAGMEGAEEIVTEALNMGYEVGVLEEDITLGEAFTRIYQAGGLGAMVGGKLAVLTHPMARKAAAEQEKADKIYKDYEAAKQNVQEKVKAALDPRSKITRDEISEAVREYEKAKMAIEDPDSYNKLVEEEQARAEAERKAAEDAKQPEAEPEPIPEATISREDEVRAFELIKEGKSEEVSEVVLADMARRKLIKYDGTTVPVILPAGKRASKSPEQVTEQAKRILTLEEKKQARQEARPDIEPEGVEPIQEPEKVESAAVVPTMQETDRVKLSAELEADETIYEARTAELKALLGAGEITDPAQRVAIASAIDARAQVVKDRDAEIKLDEENQAWAEREEALNQQAARQAERKIKQILEAKTDQDIEMATALSIFYEKQDADELTSSTPSAIRQAFKDAEQKLKLKEEKARARWNEWFDKPVQGELFSAGEVLKRGTKQYSAAVEIGAYKMARGIVRAADWTAQMVEELGSRIKPVIKELYNDARKMAGDSYRLSHQKYKTGARAGQYKAAPRGTDDTALAALRVKLRDLAEEGEVGRFWYEESSEKIIEVTGGNLEEARLLAGLISIYSAGTAVSANTSNALKAWSQWKAGKPIKAGRFGHQDEIATRWLEKGEEPTGMKRSNFYLNLLRYIDPNAGLGQGATVDLWMMRAFGYDMPSPTDAQYAFAQAEIVKLADELGWEVQQVQAAIWVAMKARWEHVAQEVKEQALKEGIGVIRTKNNSKYLDAKGKIGSETYENNRRALQALFREKSLAVASSIVRREVSKSKASFKDTMDLHYGVISWEAVRSETVAPKDVELPLEAKVELQARIAEVLTNPESGREFLAEWLGVLGVGEFQGPGAWNLRIGASSQTGLLIPPEHTPKSPNVMGVEAGAREIMDAYAMILGLILKQDAVAWGRPMYATAKKDANGVEIDIDRPIKPFEAKKFYLEVVRLAQQEFNVSREAAMELAPIVTPWGFRVQSFVDGIPNFVAGKKPDLHHIVMQAFENTFPGIAYKAEVFRVEGNMVENNWAINPKGEGYEKALRNSKNPLVRKALTRAKRELVPEINRVRKEVIGRYRKTPAKTGPSITEPRVHLVKAGEPIPPRPRNAVRFRHFGNVQTGALDPRFMGTGIKGAESAQGLPKVRVIAAYPEAGFVKEQGLKDNEYIIDIPARKVYNLSKDRRGFKKKAMVPVGLRFVKGKVVPGKEKRLDFDKLSELIRDAGYTGYYTPTGTGNFKGQARIFEKLVVENYQKELMPERETITTTMSVASQEEMFEDAEGDDLWRDRNGNVVRIYRGVVAGFEGTARLPNLVFTTNPYAAQDYAQTSARYGPDLPAVENPRYNVVEKDMGRDWNRTYQGKVVESGLTRERAEARARELAEMNPEKKGKIFWSAELDPADRASGFVVVANAKIKKPYRLGLEDVITKEELDEVVSKMPPNVQDRITDIFLNDERSDAYMDYIDELLRQRWEEEEFAPAREGDRFAPQPQVRWEDLPDDAMTWTYSIADSHEFVEQIKELGYDSMLLMGPHMFSDEQGVVPVDVMDHAETEGVQEVRLFSADQLVAPATKESRTVELGTVLAARDVNINVENFMSEWIEMTFALDPAARDERWVDDGAMAILHPWQDKIHIEAIEAIHKGQGLGSKVLKTLVELADKHQVPLELQAFPFGRDEGRLNQGNLVSWYRRNGFRTTTNVENPVYEDAPSFILMRRKPNPRGKTAFSKKHPGEGRGMNEVGLQRLVRSLLRAMPGLDAMADIHAVATPNQIPFDIRRSLDYVGNSDIQGVMHDSNAYPRPQIYLVASGLKNGQEAIETLYHEAVGHLGLRVLLGKSYDVIMGDIWVNFKEESKAAAARNKFTTDTPAKRRLAAEEFVAYTAGNLLAKKGKAAMPGFMERIVRAIKRVMVRLGLAKMNDRDILSLIASAAIVAGRGGRLRSALSGKSGSVASLKKPNFYSQMRKVIVDKMPESVPIKQIGQLLESYEKKGFFKKDEAAWIDLPRAIEETSSATDLLGITQNEELISDADARRIMQFAKQYGEEQGRDFSDLGLAETVRVLEMNDQRNELQLTKITKGHVAALIDANTEALSFIHPFAVDPNMEQYGAAYSPLLEEIRSADWFQVPYEDIESVSDVYEEYKSYDDTARLNDPFIEDYMFDNYLEESEEEKEKRGKELLDRNFKEMEKAYNELSEDEVDEMLRVVAEQVWEVRAQEQQDYDRQNQIVVHTTDYAGESHELRLFQQGGISGTIDGFVDGEHIGRFETAEKASKAVVAYVYDNNLTYEEGGVYANEDWVVGGGRLDGYAERLLVLEDMEEGRLPRNSTAHFPVHGTIGHVRMVDAEMAKRTSGKENEIPRMVSVALVDEMQSDAFQGESSETISVDKMRAAVKQATDALNKPVVAHIQTTFGRMRSAMAGDRALDNILGRGNLRELGKNVMLGGDSIGDIFWSWYKSKGGRPELLPQAERREIDFKIRAYGRRLIGHRNELPSEDTSAVRPYSEKWMNENVQPLIDRIMSDELVEPQVRELANRNVAKQIELDIRKHISETVLQDAKLKTMLTNMEIEDPDKFKQDIQGTLISDLRWAEYVDDTFAPNIEEAFSIYMDAVGKTSFTPGTRDWAKGSEEVARVALMESIAFQAMDLFTLSVATSAKNVAQSFQDEPWYTSVMGRLSGDKSLGTDQGGLDWELPPFLSNAAWGGAMVHSRHPSHLLDVQQADMRSADTAAHQLQVSRVHMNAAIGNAVGHIEGLELPEDQDSFSDWFWNEEFGENVHSPMEYRDIKVEQWGVEFIEPITRAFNMAAKAARGEKSAYPYQGVWRELLVKATILDAVNRGKDAIALVPGQVHAVRWDSSERLFRLSANVSLRHEPMNEQLLADWVNDKKKFAGLSSRNSMPGLLNVWSSGDATMEAGGGAERRAEFNAESADQLSILAVWKVLKYLQQDYANQLHGAFQHLTKAEIEEQFGKAFTLHPFADMKSEVMAAGAYLIGKESAAELFEVAGKMAARTFMEKYPSMEGATRFLIDDGTMFHANQSIGLGRDMVGNGSLHEPTIEFDAMRFIPVEVGGEPMETSRIADQYINGQAGFYEKQAVMTMLKQPLEKRMQITNEEAGLTNFLFDEIENEYGQSSDRARGLRIFYNEVLPNLANKFLKKYKTKFKMDWVQLGRASETSASSLEGIQKLRYVDNRTGKVEAESKSEWDYRLRITDTLAYAPDWLDKSDKKAVAKYISEWRSSFADTEMPANISLEPLRGTANDYMIEGLLPVAEFSPQLKEAAKGEGFSLYARNRRSPNQDALDRFNKKIGRPRMPFGLRAYVKALWHRLGTKLRVETLDGLYAVLEAERDQGIHPDNMGYVSARLAAGSESLVRTVLENGPPVWFEGAPDIDADPDAPGLFEILSPLQDGNRLTLWTNWMVANRAKRLKEEERERLFEEDEIEAVIEEVERMGFTQEFEEIRDAYANFKSRVLDFAQEAGVINADSRALWENIDHIPFYRVLESDGVAGAFSSGTIGYVRKQVYQLKGGVENLRDPLENILLNITNLIDASLKNNASRQIHNNLKDTGLVRKLPNLVVDGKVKVSMEEIRNRLNDAGVALDAVGYEMLSGFGDMLSFGAPGGDNVTSFLENGKRVYFAVEDPLVLKGLQSIRPQAWTWLMWALRAPKRLGSAAITAMPDFILKNWFRDMWHAFVLARDPRRVLGASTGVGTVPVADAVRGALNALRRDETYVRVASGGGAFESGYVNAHDPAAMAKVVRGRLSAAGFKQDVLDTPRKMWEFYRQLSSSAENSNRVQVYRNAVAAGKSHKLASFEARDLMDFSMRGSHPVIRFLTESVMFLNARAQGLYRTGKGFRENPFATLARGVPLMLASVLLALKNWDDERYKGMEDWERAAYYHFFDVFEEGDHYRLPKPFEVGAVFSTTPEIAVIHMLSQEPDKGKHTAQALAHLITENLNLSPQIQTFTPIYEVMINKSLFTERPIVSDWEEKALIPELQKGSNTSPVVAAIAEAMPDAAPDMLRSPKKLEHLLNGYMTSLGALAIAGADYLWYQMHAEEDGLPPTMREDELPLMKSFVRGKEGPKYNKYITDLYEIMDEADRLYYSIEKMEKTGDPEQIEKAMKLREENFALLSVRKPFERAKKQLSKLNKAIRATYTNPNMDPEEKREAIDEMIRAKNEIAKGIWSLRPGGPDNPGPQAEDFIGMNKKESTDALRGAGYPRTADLVASAMLSQREIEELLSKMG